MVIRRRYASVPPMLWGTSRSRSYDVMPASLAARAYLMSSPLSRADKHAYDRHAQDYLDHRVTDASFLSSYALEEGYDTARKSRNRDAQLLRDATDAIVNSESFATPQMSVAARRVVRGQSLVPLRAASVPPRPLYPTEVDFWDTPRTHKSLYSLKTAHTTTTDEYYPDLSYTRRPLIFYPNPWLYRYPSRVVSPRIAERAKSVPPAYFYPEEPRRMVQPVFDDWRRAARALSVPAEVRPYYARPLYYPYAGGYGSYQHRLSPYYLRRLALHQPRYVAPFWPLATEGLKAHRAPRYLSRVAERAGVPTEWDYLADKHRLAEEEELAHLKHKARAFKPRVLGSPLARASFARAWKHAAHPFAPAYFKDAWYGYPLLYVARKGPKQGGRQKVALMHTKMEADFYKPKRPRSEYAARKYRAMRVADQESIYTKHPQTTTYYASQPSLKRRW